MTRTPGRTRSRTWLALRLVLTLGLLALACWTNREQLRDVFGRSIDPRPFALGMALYLAGLVLAYGRWYLLVRTLGMPFRFRDALRLGFIGALFNFVIPGAIGGNFIRAAYLCREQRGTTRPIATVAVDFFSGLLGLFLLACLAGAVGWSRLDEETDGLVIVAGIAAAVTAAVLALAFVPGLARLRPRRKRLARVLGELAAVGASYRKHFGVVILGVVLGVLTHGLNVAAFYCGSRALYPEVPGLTQHFLIVPLVLFSTAVPLPFGALGVSEQVSKGLFEMVSYPGGGVAMMAFRVFQFGGALVGTAYYLANLGQVRELSEEARQLNVGLDRADRSDDARRERASAGAREGVGPCSPQG